MQQRESKNSEKMVIENIINNKENTMASWPSATIANSLLKLSEKYGLDSPETQEKIITEIDHWIDSLAKPASDLPEKEAAAAKAEAARVKAAFNTLKNKMNEETNELDSISLIRNGQKISYEISIKRTLAIVFYALAMDTSLPKENLNDRLHSFKCMILKMETKNDCHQGWRHTIAELLIGVHPDVRIIIDMISFICNIVSDHKYHLLMKLAETKNQKLEFWKALFEKAKKGEEHPLLIQEFENSQTELMLTLENKLKEYDINLKKLYAYKDIKDILNNLIEINLSLPIDSDLFLQALACIFNLRDIKNSPIETAVTRIKAYLKDHPEIFNNTKTELQKGIVDFYVNLQAFELFKKYEKILISWDENHITAAEIANLSALFRNYFDTCFKQESSQVSEAIQEDLSKALQKFSTAVMVYEKDMDIAVISNFFSLWKSARDDRDTERQIQLLAKLIDPAYKKKTILSDEFLTNIYMQHENTNVYLSPYLINRIFMHALSVPVSTWTKLFEAVFSDILTFVSAGFHSEDNRFQADSLKKNSYPRQLLNQFVYLKILHQLAYLKKNDAGYKTSSGSSLRLLARSVYIPMMHFAENINEFNREFSLFPESNRSAFLKMLGHKFITNLIKNRKDLIKILQFLPETERLNFLNSLGVDFIKSLIKNQEDLSKILGNLPGAEKIIFLENLKSDYATNILILAYTLMPDDEARKLIYVNKIGYNIIKDRIKEYEDLAFILKFFPEDEKINFFESLGDDFIKSFIKCGASLRTILSCLPETKRKIFWDGLSIGFIENLINNTSDLATCLSNFPKDERLIYIDKFENDFIKKLIKHDYDIENLLAILPHDDRIKFFNNLASEFITDFITHLSSLVSILRLFPETERVSFFNKLGITFIKSVEDLIEILRQLSEAGKVNFLDKLGIDFINPLIKNHEDLIKILNHIPQTQRLIYINSFGASVIKTSGDLSYILKNLHETERLIFIKNLGTDFIKRLIKNTGDLNIILQNLLVTDRLILLNNLGTRIIGSIKNLVYVLKYIPENQRLIYINNLGIDNIEGFIKTSEDLKNILEFLPLEDRESFSQSLEASRAEKRNRKTSDNSYLPLHSGSYEARSRKNSQNAHQENVQVNSTQTISSNRQTV